MIPNSSGIDYSLQTEELEAQRTALKGRLIALAVITVLVTFLAPWPAPVFFYLLICGHAVSRWAALRIQQSRWNRAVYQYAFVTLDCVLVALALLYPNPFQPNDLPPQFMLRFGSFIFFFIVLAELTYLYRPKLVLWGGVSIALCWSAGVGLLLLQPETVWEQPDEMDLTAVFALQSNPYFINLDIRLQEVVMVLLIAVLLALAVSRSRAIVVRQARFARERANLARYFPSKTASLLAERDNPFSAPREHHSAVIFADLVGFTEWSERHSPAEVITLLRAVQGMMSEVVFRHEGTLDKFLGDGLMATFGTPEPTPRDATNALAATVEMADAFHNWASAPDNHLAEGLKLSIGGHYGPVVIGNIGSEDRLEFAVLGDTVNVASRLEAATRAQGCAAILSDSLIAQARGEDAAGNAAALARLVAQPGLSLRGRDGRLDVHLMTRSAP